MRTLIERVSTATLAKGIAYASEGRVRMLSVTPHGSDATRVVASVRGARQTPYELKLTLHRAGTRLVAVEGRCSCPVGRECKHMVAVVARYIEMQEQQPMARRELLAASVSSSAPAAPVLERNAPARLLLGQSLREWLTHATPLAARLRSEGNAPAPVHAPQAGDVLLYLLHSEPRVSPVAVTVSVLKATRLPNGDYDRAARWLPTRLDPQRLPAFVAVRDVSIIQSLSAADGREAPKQALCGSRGALLLAEMLGTERCHWQTIESPPLQLGASRAGHAEWSMDSRAVQRLTLRVDPAASVVLGVEPPWYIDAQSCEAAPVETPFAPALAALVTREPSCTVGESAACAQMFRESLPELPAPRVIDAGEGLREPPVPVLTLSTLTAAPDTHELTPQKLDLAALSFRYGDCVVDPNDISQSFHRVVDGNVQRVVRDRAAEIAAHHRLMDTGMQRVSHFYNWRAVRSGFVFPRDKLLLTLGPVAEGRWLEWVAVAEPELVAAGWEVHREPGFRFNVVRPTRWTAHLHREPAGWIECELGVEVDGAMVSLQQVIERFSRTSPAEVKRFVEQDPQTMPPFVWRLDDGRALRIPAAWLQGVLRALAEVSDKRTFARPQKLQVTPLTALDMTSLETAGVDVRLDEGLTALRKALSQRHEWCEAPPPKSLRAELRDYQRRGLSWLQWLRACGLGGVLADDMGLGKTLQALAHVLVEKEQGRLNLPVLVVVPTSVVANWDSEAARFAPALKRLILHGADRSNRFAEIDGGELVITTYALLLRDIGELKQHRFSLVILDEAQYIKNERARTAKAVRELQSRQWLAMSGTPMQNHLGELWAVIDAVCPGLLGDSKSFSQVYRGPIERRQDEQRRQLLERRTAPFVLRRTKEQVAKDLPPKTTTIQRVELVGAQRTLYETIRAAAHAKIQAAIHQLGIRRCQLLILEALLRLRQVCCEPALIDMPQAQQVEASAKRELLWEMLPSMLDEGRRVLLFSSFASLLKRIRQQVEVRGIPHAMLIGETVDRTSEIRRFQGGEAKLMLISLKAGGVGLNLTAADTVIHYDPWWNPAAEDQATDRAHRIGQSKPVFVYKLIACDTVEERMLELQTDKRALIQGVLRPSAQRTTFIDLTDLELLLAPLASR